MQNAFSAAPLHASLPAIAAGEPLAGIVLGILVFGDRVQITPGLLAIEAGGIVALIVGVVAVARSSAFSGLRKITDVKKIADVAKIPDVKKIADVAKIPDVKKIADVRKITGVIRPGSDSADSQAAKASRRESPNGSAPAAPDGSFPAARKFSRPAHRRQVHDSPSGGEGL
jgi:hypothetical protein